MKVEKVFIGDVALDVGLGNLCLVVVLEGGGLELMPLFLPQDAKVFAFDLMGLAERLAMLVKKGVKNG